MTKGTFWIKEETDGSILLGCEDYDVEVFGGGDYEWIYSLDPENAAKFKGVLSEKHRGTLEKMVEAEFGVGLDGTMQWLKDHGIEYEFNSWVHYN